MKKTIITLFLLFLLFPISIFAYSNRILVGGNTIGMEVHSDGVYVVGFYSVFGKEIAKNAGFQVGDVIVKIDQHPISNISQLNSFLNQEKDYSFEVLRNHEFVDLSLPVLEENATLKTGLFVKDQVYGIGTLSFIDPETRIFGSLGHEILESTSKNKFSIQNGKIYKAEVSSVQKSTGGKAGSMNANVDSNITIGSVLSNDSEGIFGKYLDDLSSFSSMDVGTIYDIHSGKAYIRTVTSKDNVEDYSIKILSIREDSDFQNILFEVTDSKLLSKTGGIVQGMSGSPIIQDNKIVGVVNYVILDEPYKGYGIFITKMLERGDEIVS